MTGAMGYGTENVNISGEEVEKYMTDLEVIISSEPTGPVVIQPQYIQQPIYQQQVPQQQVPVGAGIGQPQPPQQPQFQPPQFQPPQQPQFQPPPNQPPSIGGTDDCIY